MNINSDLISEINKLKIKIDNNKSNNDSLHNLKEKSIEIIDYIVNNIKISNIKTIEIPEFRIDNVTINLLKESKNIVLNDIEMENFIINLKQDNLPQKEIEEYIEFNNNEIDKLLYQLLLKNNNIDINNIIKYYSKDIISKFVPLNIQREIIKKLKFNLKFDVYLDNKNLEFNFFMEDKNYNGIDITIIIVKAFYLVVLYNIKNVNIKLNYYLTLLKKEIPLNKNYLGVNEINSGLTTIYQNKSEINIYRKEEYEKLTIHEMVHALKIDHNLFKSDNSIGERLKCNFNISKLNKINFFECFTESIAIILNSIINSILVGTNLNDIINSEIKFSILQCSKIIKFYKADSKKFLCNNCCFKSNDNWIEKTSITAYFFCKLGIILNINNFIEEYMFNKNIIIKNLYDEILKNLLTIEFLDEYKITNKLYKTLRMSINEFNWNKILNSSLNINTVQ